MNFLSTVSIISLAVVLLTGCSSPEDSNEEREKQMEAYAKQYGIDADVKIGADGEPQVQVNQQVGGGSAQVGTNLQVPDSFPKDITLYPNMKVISTAQLPIGHMLQAQSSDMPEKIADHFRQEMVKQGWRDESPAAHKGSPVTGMRFIKDDRAAGITVMRAGDMSNVQIALTPAG